MASLVGAKQVKVCSPWRASESPAWLSREAKRVKPADSRASGSFFCSVELSVAWVTAPGGDAWAGGGEDDSAWAAEVSAAERRRARWRVMAGRLSEV